MDRKALHRISYGLYVVTSGKEGNGLFMIDKELATRVFTPPPATSNESQV